MKRITTVAIALLLASAFCLLPAKADDTAAATYNLGWWAAMKPTVSSAIDAYESATTMASSPPQSAIDFTTAQRERINRLEKTR